MADSNDLQELANESIKAETAAIDKANLFAAQGAGETEVGGISALRHPDANLLISFLRTG
jgi:hypothetical protein